MLPNVIKISAEDRTPLVDALLKKLEDCYETIEHLNDTIVVLKEQNQILKDEITALKKSPKRPKFSNKNRSKTNSKDDITNNPDKKRPGSEKRAKKNALRVDETTVITPDEKPKDATLKRTRTIIVQDLIVKSHNTKYIIEEWITSDGKVIPSQLPEGVEPGETFGKGLHQFVMYQYYHCQVTQPLIREQLLEFGVDISAGEINQIIVEGNESFHQEKNEILRTGLEISTWIQTDDTGARHQGKTGYCTHIGNHLFAWFGSSGSKSRVNFLGILNAAFSGGYKLDGHAFRYMIHEKLPQKSLLKLQSSMKRDFLTESDWQHWLKSLGIVKPRHIKIATEAALFSGALAAGMREDLIILSDDAGQFNIPLLLHALCWVHEVRHIKNLVPSTDEGRNAQGKVLSEIWDFYRQLKEYCLSPNAASKVALENAFDLLFTTTTCFAGLNLALKRIHDKKQELLVVLDHPELPQHNNGSEGDIREFVKKRKVSGGTRSASGRQSRDTFASLKKTCRKLNVSFWKYLQDRLNGAGLIERLSALMIKKAAENNPSSVDIGITGVA